MLIKTFTEIKKSLQLAIPLLFAEWLFAINFFAITWIAARLGREALAALALAQTINIFLFMMISGVSAATAIVAAQTLGRNASEEVKYIFAQSLLLNGVLAVLAGIIMWQVPNLLQIIKVGDQQVIAQVEIALHGFLWNIIPFTLLIMFEKFLIGMHRTRLVLFFTSISIPISIIANYIIVLGKFGLPQYGLVGVGYSLAIAYSCLDLLFILMVFIMPSLRCYNLFSGLKNLPSTFKYFFELWDLGWPLGIMFSIELGAILVFTILMSFFGTDVLAAFQISRQYLVFALVTLFALTESSAVRVGFAFGAKDYSLILRGFYVNLGIATFCMLLLAGVYVFARDILIAQDVNFADPKNSNLIMYARHFLIAIAVLVIFDGIRNLAAGGLRGLNDSKFTMYSSIVGYWILGLPLAYFFGKVCNLGGDGLWAGFILGIIVSAIMLFVRFRKIINDKV